MTFKLMLISSSKVKANKYSKLIDTKLIDALLPKKKSFDFRSEQQNSS